MGLRANLKRTFTSSSSTKKNSTSSQSTGPNGEILYMQRTDIEYYKPNDIPKSKYRGRVDPDHAASLQAFSLTDAFSAVRRSSLALSGTFSPGGTRAPSAAQSRVQSRAPSRRPSVHEHSGLRMHSELEDETRSSSSTSRAKSLAASTILDVGTANTSLSDQPTAGPSFPPSSTKLLQHDSGIDMAGLSKQVTAHDTPFTPEELDQAMIRATTKSSRFSGERRIGVAY